MALFKYCLFFPLLLHSFLLASRIPCPLEWESASSGSIPDQAVQSSPGEYVARVFLDDDWYAININPRLPEVSVVVNGKEFTYENYEVLINPHKCVLKWIRRSNEKESHWPKGAVPIAVAGSVYVGRGKHGSQTVSGTISEMGLDITHKGKQILLPRFEILESTDPLLYGSLSSIKFTVPSDLYTAAYQELVGSSLHEVINFSGSLSDNERVIHEKVLRETFIFTEDANNWDGISSMQVSFDLWFGTSDVDELVQVNWKNYIEIKRARTLKVSKNITIGPNRNMQVCTFFLKPSPGTEIPFTAIAEFTADGDDLTIENIKEIVVRSGRVILESFPESKTVTTSINGKMTGRFALDMGSIEYLLDRTKNLAGQCMALNGKPRSI
ncbi:unnamed protein product [Allacma fusca]|uniref:Uncharacterized protein n=1 Tax=Allacma fusca TaxID=39272 RepID=A0A8J2JHE4_9HEXA|nr:unnamed protein product [Allacma fusca]